MSKKRDFPEGEPGKSRPLATARKGFNNRGLLSVKSQSFFAASAAWTILSLYMGGTSS